MDAPDLQDKCFKFATISLVFHVLNTKGSVYIISAIVPNKLNILNLNIFNIIFNKIKYFFVIMVHNYNINLI